MAVDYQIKIEAFEGPFDLLLHLIEKNEVDIYDIPIAEITAQYLDYIEAMESLDINVASEFLVMAATLLAIKARMLLPKPPPELLEEGEEYDPRADLVQNLLEYKRIKEAAACLETYYQNRQKIHARPNDESLYSSFFAEVHPLEGKTLEDLAVAFGQVWQKVKDEAVIHAIPKDAVSIGMMMEKLYCLLEENLSGILFSEIFTDCPSKLHLVVAFLALLEFMKLSIVRVQQDKVFGKIYILPYHLENYEKEA